MGDAACRSQRRTAPESPPPSRDRVGETFPRGAAPLDRNELWFDPTPQRPLTKGLACAFSVAATAINAGTDAMHLRLRTLAEFAENSATVGAEIGSYLGNFG